MAILLTARQRQCLTFIQDAVRKEGRPPTVRELMGHLGVTSTNGITDHLNALVRKGYITRDNSLSRGIKLVGESQVMQPNSSPNYAAGIASFRAVMRDYDEAPEDGQVERAVHAAIDAALAKDH